MALADSLSDALGIHMAQESQNRHSPKEIWESTLATFMTKLFIALTFLIPIFLLPNTLAITISITWGLFLLILLNLYLAKIQQLSAWLVVSEHLVIAFFVIGISFLIGQWLQTKVV